jgi:phospholipid transport system substrate-binding protein
MGSTQARGLAALALLGLLAGAPPPAPSAEGAGPREVVAKTIDEALAVLKDEKLSKQERRSRVQEIAYARFDFDTMSRLVLARNWSRFSEPQKAEFEREFKTFLARSYGSRLDAYDHQEVAIIGEQAEPRGDVTIRTRIQGGDFEGVAMDYRLRDRGGEWRVIDVVIEGISLVANYRDQFKEVLSRGGPDGLLHELRQKNSVQET